MTQAKHIWMAVLALVIILSGAGGCKKENMCDCLKRTGDVTEEVRAIDPFTEIFVEDKVNVILTEDTSAAPGVTIEAGENLIPLIKTEVVNGVLRIRNANKCDFTRSYDVPVNVYVTCKRNLVRITNKGTGDITNTDTCTAPWIDLNTVSAGNIRLQMNAGSVFTHQHSVGDVEITGIAQEVIVFNTGNGFTIADNCPAWYCWVYTKSTGKITLHPVNQLSCEIDGPGNVYYRGNPPNISSLLHSSGQLLPY